MVCVSEPRNARFWENFVAPGMLWRWGNAFSGAGGAAWPWGGTAGDGGAPGMSWYWVECQVHKPEEWNPVPPRCPATRARWPVPVPDRGRCLEEHRSNHTKTFPGPVLTTGRCREERATTCACALRLFHQRRRNLCQFLVRHPVELGFSAAISRMGSGTWCT